MQRPNIYVAPSVEWARIWPRTAGTWPWSCAKLHPDGSIDRTLTSDGAGAERYHEYAITYDPATRTTSLSVDGLPVGQGNPGFPYAGSRGLIEFGIGSAVGRGSANVSLVELTIGADAWRSSPKSRRRSRPSASRARVVIRFVVGGQEAA